VRVCELRIGESPAPAGLKHLCRLEQVLAQIELRGHDVAQGLFSVPAKVGVAKALWIARLTHVAAAGLDAEYQLSLVDASKRSVNHRGYVFTFMKLEPERDTRNQPNASDYRASIEIAK